jgi:hypothetical protein
LLRLRLRVGLRLRRRAPAPPMLPRRAVPVAVNLAVMELVQAVRRRRCLELVRCVRHRIGTSREETGGCPTRRLCCWLLLSVCPFEDSLYEILSNRMEQLDLLSNQSCLFFKRPSKHSPRLPGLGMEECTVLLLIEVRGAVQCGGQEGGSDSSTKEAMPRTTNLEEEGSPPKRNLRRFVPGARLP